MPDGKRIPTDDELRAARRAVQHVALYCETVKQRLAWEMRLLTLHFDEDNHTVAENLVDRAAGG